MASASSKRTLDTDYITLRKVFAKVSDNRQVPPGYVLTSVGDGRTYWSEPSTLGGLPTFSEFQFDGESYVGTTDSSFLQISASNGVGLSSVSTSLQVLGKNFSILDVSGVSSIYAFSNFLLNNSLFIASEGFLSTSTTPSQNLLTLSSSIEIPILSTNIISFQSLKVISSLLLPIDTSPYLGNMIYSKTDTNTFPIFAGVKDFVFRTNFVQPIAGIELSSYSAKAFLDLSTLAATSFVSTISSISSLYTQADIFSTALRSLSTTEFINYSTNVSTTLGLSNYTQITYNQKVGDTLARATIIQLNDEFGILNTGVSTISSFKTPLYIMLSTNQGFVDSYSTPTSLSSSTFLDFTAGSIFNFTINGMNVVSTQLSTLSTSIGSNLFTMSNGIQVKLPPFSQSTLSTIVKLGSLDYVSTPSLYSTVKSLGSEGYISTSAIVSSFSTFLQGFPSSFSQSFISTTKGLNDRQEIISTLTLQSSIVSSTKGVFLEAAYTYVSTNGLSHSIRSTTAGLFDYAGTFGYISTQSLASTLQSTVRGLSTTFYVTTKQAYSSIQSTTNGVDFVRLSTVQSVFSTSSNYFQANDLVSTTDFFLNYSRQFFSTLIVPTAFSQQQVNMVPIFGGQAYDTNQGSNFYFSSVQFASLAGYDSLIQNAKYLTIEYRPTLFFPPSETLPNVNGGYAPALSTGIQIGSTFLPGTLYQDKFVAPFSNDPYSSVGGISNVYSKKIILQIDSESFLQAKSNGFSIAHIFENLTDGYGNYFRFDSNVSLYTPRTNSLFISIYN